MILAPKWLLHVSTLSCRLPLSSLHLTIKEIFVKHNTTLKTVLEQKLIIDYTLRHLLLPDFDDGDDDDDNNNRTNSLCVQIPHKTKYKSKITLYFNSIPERDPQ